MELAITAALFVCILLGSLFLTYWTIHQKRRSLPPGPTPLPFLGTLRTIKPHLLHETYVQLSEKYGPVVTVWMGSTPVVLLCGYDTVKDALVNHAEEFSGRAILTSDIKVNGAVGIISSNGEEWQTRRRFTITTLRNFGMGKRSMEERVQVEAHQLIKAIKDTDGKAFDPMVHLQSAVANVICLVVFGERFDYKDRDFLQILHIVEQYIIFLRSSIGQVSVCCCVSSCTVQELDLPANGRPGTLQNEAVGQVLRGASSHIAGADQLYNSIPTIMDYLPGPHHIILKETQFLRDFIQKKIDSHRLTLNTESPRDFIDCFLMKENKKEFGFTNQNLVASVSDIFTAGTETTKGSLQYSLLVMAKYPHIQAKLQQEIDDVVGPTRHPSIDDRVKMTYTNAVIFEIQRFLDIAPIALPHSTTRDTEFHGYHIPKGTKVIPILSSVLHDPKQWETSDEFNPAHFLDEKGALKNSAAFMPFSAGKRLCPGEGLARMEIFLFLTFLLQQFTFQSVADPASLDLAVLRRAFRSTGLAFQVRAVPRHITQA